MIVELVPGVTVDMHPATGRDSLIAWSVRARMEEFTPEYNIRGGFNYQADFASIVAQTDQINGLDFALPHWELDGEMLAEGFRAWLALPAKIVDAWRDALEKVEPDFNAPDLKPGAKPKTPLAVKSETSSEGKSTTT